VAGLEEHSQSAARDDGRRRRFECDQQALEIRVRDDLARGTLSE
jgi:hypothetical protein